MPLYEFTCTKCGKVFEELLSLAELEAGDLECPTCGARWEDGCDSFWEGVRADGWFPGRCPACGGSLPEWWVTEIDAHVERHA